MAGRDLSSELFGATNAPRDFSSELFPVDSQAVPQSAADQLGMAYKNLKDKASSLPYIGGIARGFLDLPQGATQLLAHGLSSAGIIDPKAVAQYDALSKDSESKYQNNRKLNNTQGESPGFDYGRLGGNIISTLPASALGPAKSLAGRVGQGMGIGGLTSALSPTEGGDDYWQNKLIQSGIGVGTGSAIPLLGAGISKIISPSASKNPNVELLRNEGVNPTTGQTLGGRWNALEEKLTSVPILGDMISSARQKALNQFNQAAINRAVEPIGETIDQTGQAGIKQAGDKLSKAYQDTLGQIKGVSFDPQFGQDLQQLHGMAQNLVPAMRDKFNGVLQDIVMGRISKTGSMLPETYKAVDSELGNLASKFGKSQVASEGELGDAVSQLQQLLKQQMVRSNPDIASKISAIDSGWANLVRVERAGVSGKNAEGIFTPGQLNQAISTADDSVRKRAISRGTALMQDLGNAGQSVLGNKVPNSFTADRAMVGLGALGTGAINPMIPASLMGGAALYSSPAQNLINAALTRRPQSAQPIADAIGQYSPLAVPSILGLLNQNR